jgi:mRNA interferase HicA
MNANQLKRWLVKRGCRFELGKGGHIAVILRDRKTYMPVHGGNKQVGKGLIRRILKDLAINDPPPN